MRTNWFRGVLLAAFCLIGIRGLTGWGTEPAPSDLPTADRQAISPAVPQPRELPEPTNSKPLELPSSAQSAVRDVIQKSLPNSTAEERDIWYQQLKDLPAGAVRDLLEVRRQMGVPLGESGLSDGFAPLPLAPSLAFPSPERDDFSADPRQRNDESAATREAIQKAIRWHSHNLANSQTPGYRRLRIFLIDAAIQQDDSAPNAPSFGCRLAPLTLDTSTGRLEPTGLPLDVAIEGPGWLAVLHDDGVRFTRSGGLAVNADGCLYLITAGPEACLKPPMTIPTDSVSVTITSDGRVMSQLPGEKEAKECGRLQLARFEAATLLEPAGGGLYRETTASGQAVFGNAGEVGFGSLKSGVLERSNVNSEDERARVQDLRILLDHFEAKSPSKTPSQASEGFRFE